MTTLTTDRTQFVTSSDGTKIAYETTGSGPSLVLVDGAMCQRGLGPSRGLAEALAGNFCVYRYDRRGRGDSGAGTRPYTPAREVEDLHSLIEAAGGSAHVLGVSSGAVLALEAARPGASIDRLVVYQAPFIVDDAHPANDLQLPQRLQDLVDGDRRGDAVRLLLRTVGAPPPFIAMMRLTPAWKQMTRIAPHPPLRPGDRHRPPAGPSHPDQLLPGGHAEHPRPRRRQEPPLHAERTGGHRQRRPPRAVRNPGRTDAHGQAEGRGARSYDVPSPAMTG